MSRHRAVVPGEPTPYTFDQAWWAHGAALDPEDGGHTTDGGRVYGVTHARYAECDDYGCKPVLVIDPEDRDMAEALCIARWTNVDPLDVEKMQATLRGLVADLVALAEGRIAEPGTWGVVEAACTHDPTRREWTRHPDGDWYTKGGGDEWSDLVDPVLVREGVEE